MFKKLLLAAFPLFLFGIPVHADAAHFTYEFSIQNAPGGIGDFSWEVTTFGLLPLGETQFINFNQVSSPSSGLGCQITSVLLEGEGDGIGMTTFFMPLCRGLFDSETSGFAVNPGQVGVYSASGTNPDDTINTATFRVFQSNLPVTTPEASTFALLGTAMAFLTCLRKVGRIVSQLEGHFLAPVKRVFLIPPSNEISLQTISSRTTSSYFPSGVHLA